MGSTSEFLEEPQNPNYSIVISDSAVWSVRQFGAQAKPAFTSIFKLSNDTNPNFRAEITNTLLGYRP